ncbi:unnamed protein product, partial [Discosporangium mesarthrocarpum]
VQVPEGGKVGEVSNEHNTGVSGNRDEVVSEQGKKGEGEGEEEKPEGEDESRSRDLGHGRGKANGEQGRGVKEGEGEEEGEGVSMMPLLTNDNTCGNKEEASSLLGWPGKAPSPEGPVEFDLECGGGRSRGGSERTCHQQQQQRTSRVGWLYVGKRGKARMKSPEQHRNHPEAPSHAMQQMRGRGQSVGSLAEGTMGEPNALGWGWLMGRAEPEGVTSTGLR